MFSILQSIGWWGIDFHVSAFMLLLVAVSFFRRVRQPARRLAIGWSAAAGLALLAVLTMLPGWPRIAWRRPPREAFERAAVVSAATNEPTETAPDGGGPSFTGEAAPAAAESASDQRIDGATSLASPNAGETSTSAGGMRFANLDYPATVGAALVVGAIAANVWLLIGAAQAIRLRRRSSHADEYLNELLRRADQASGKKPRLLVNADVAIPLAMRLFRPVIILPERYAASAAPAELEAAISHELAHIRHGDLWLLALLRLLLPLLIWQPLYWWLRRAIGAAQEELADAAAARRVGRVAYAETLLNWARMAPGDSPRFNGALAMWERPSQIKRRVALLLDRDFEVAPNCSLRSRAAVAVLMLALAVSLSLPSFHLAVSAADDNSPRAGHTVSFTGRVLAQGLAVAGAKVYLRESPISWSHTEVGWRPSVTRDVAQTVADVDGRFEFKDVNLPEPKLGRDHAFPLDVIAIAPGRGIAWRHLAAAPTAPVQLSLPDERKVAGQLVERDGKPVAGARVRLRELAALSDPWRPLLHTPSYLDLESCGAPPSAVSDADGYFALRCVPDGARATLVVDDDRFLMRETVMAATDEPQDTLTEWIGDAKSRSVPVRSWYCKIEVEHVYRLRGRVVFADTGEPAVGAGFNHPPILSPPDGITDADGRFTLTRLAAGKVSLRITPPPGGRYLGSRSEVVLSGDNDDVEQVVQLSRGELVRGQVVDAKSGKGIGGGEVWYVAKRDSRTNPETFVERVESAADGRFSIAVPPGKAELIVIGSVRGYVTFHQSGPVTAAPAEFHQPIDVQAGQQHAEVIFKLQSKPNAAVTGRVVDADGKPMAGAEVLYQGFGKQGGSGMTLPPVRTTSDVTGAFAFEDLDPSLEYGVRVVDRQRGLGAFVLLSRLENKQPALEIKAQSLAVASGRVTDDQHQALAAVVWLRHWQGGYGHVDQEPLATDAEGRFELAGLLPGVKYSMEARAEGYAVKADDPFIPTTGENHALGDIVLPRADRDVSGVLVDADGQPVVGALVQAKSALADMHYSAATAVQITDHEGRFQLRGLPAGDARVWQTFGGFDHRKRLLGQIAAGSQNLRFVVEKPQPAQAQKRE
ncbi:MAG TPA: carboxypeptidase regulatory-like domain-containing protein [Pirellulales bacterium]